MSLSKVLTRAALGVEAPLVTIEAHISNGLPALTLVGLPETTVKEARERVRSAIINAVSPSLQSGSPSIWLRRTYPKRADGMTYPWPSPFWSPLSSFLPTS